MSKANNNFTIGFNNWRKAGKKIDKHSKSQSHRQALAICSKILSRINRQFVQATELERKCWREVLRPLIDVIVFLSTRDSAIRGHDEVIGSFRNGNFLDIIKLLNQVIELLGVIELVLCQFKSYTELGIAEVIFTFPPKNSINVKYCRGRSYDNANNIERQNRKAFSRG